MNPIYSTWSWRLLGMSLVVAVGYQMATTWADEPPVEANAAAPAKANASAPADAPRYNRDIRPILAENCFACHGPDSAARQADLRLDKRDVAIEMKVLVPGKVDESGLIARIISDDPDERMPPPTSHKKLTPEQKETLRRWIAAGAEYEPHWSLIPPQRPNMPVVKNESWVRNPIDRFVLAKLEERSLGPAPEADRRVLARRWSLDIIGLPPEPAEVRAFLNDNEPDAAERYIDMLLAKPQWGEHRARYWLDYARYGDTHGIHFDNYREMWSYRDWLIGAFNKNMPYDQFTLESLAGDLLPDATLDQRVGSGFNRCNITTNEGGIIDEEYIVLYARDRTDTTSQIWLGLSAGCAVCHDHKFDPISQKEFYEFTAFFNNTTQGARDGNIRDTPPVIMVPQPEDRPRFDQIAGELAAAKMQLEDRQSAAEPDFAAWLAEARPDKIAATIPTERLHLRGELNEGEGNTLHFEQDGMPVTATANDGFAWVSGRGDKKALAVKPGEAFALPTAGDFESDQPFSYGVWIRPMKKDLGGAVFARMDSGNNYRGWDLWLQGGRIGTHIVNAWPGNALKAVSKSPLKVNQWQHVFVTYDGKKSVNGVKIYINGVAQPVDIEADKLRDSIRTDKPLKIGQRHGGDRTQEVELFELRLYQRALSPLEVSVLGQADRMMELLGKQAEQRSEQERKELRDWWFVNLDPQFQALQAKVEQMTQEAAAFKARGTVAHVMQEKNEMAKAFILARGEYDKRKDEVRPATLSVLPPFPADLPRNRLGLAKWILLPEQPLTARVTVNRCWQELFGAGLVRTAGDFGVSGELPSHPELLDFLAVEFRDGGWDVKKLYRLMLTSAAYRQSAAITPEKLRLDPQNRLLSRGPRFRMDAEMVRDYALAAGGILNRKLGGPSVKPYQPPGVWEAVAMPESDTRNYKQDSGDKLYRRSMYTFVKRAAPPASLEVFNATNREQCTVRRERTNTPLQALVTLNDPQFVEAARYLAEAALKSGGVDDAARFDFAAQRVLSRGFRPAEIEILTGSLADFRKHYADHADAAAKLLTFGEHKSDPNLPADELAAWTMLINEIMNMDEVLNK